MACPRAGALLALDRPNFIGSVLGEWGKGRRSRRKLIETRITVVNAAQAIINPCRGDVPFCRLF